MPSENYKKITIAAIAVIVVAIVVISVMTSDDKKEQPTARGPQGEMVPPGPVTGSPLQSVDQLESLPDDPKELARLADRYFESSRFGEAVQIYQKVLEKDPNDIDSYNDLGLALHYTRQSDAAIDVLKKGTEVMPSYQRLWLSLGFIQMAVGKNDEAKTSLEKAVALNSQNDVGTEAVKLLQLLKEK